MLKFFKKIPGQTEIIHYVIYGVAACMKEGLPKDWPAGHVWTFRWADVTCPDCLKGRPYIDTYTLTTDGGITCLRCKITSYSPEDVKHHYCGKCGICHDDIWPPARRFWLDN